MYLSRIHLNPRCREVQRDLADPYQLHSTLCRAFCAPAKKCPPGEFLWRIEPDKNATALPCVLVQSRSLPDWAKIGVQEWLEKADPAIDLATRLNLGGLEEGQRFRFRLRANPCVTRHGKRLGLLRREEQQDWLMRKAELHGFTLPPRPVLDFYESDKGAVDVRITQEQMLRGKQHCGNAICIYSVLYEGILTVIEPEKVKVALHNGVGHGKVLGLGLLSVIPVL